MATVSRQFVSPLDRVLRSVGIDARAITSGPRLPSRIPVPVAAAIWKRALNVTAGRVGDLPLGVAVAARMDGQSHGLLALAFSSGPSLHTLAPHLQAAHSLATDDFRVDIRNVGVGRVEIHADYLGAMNRQLPRVHAEYVVSGWVHLLRRTCSPDIPLAIRSRDPHDPRIAALARALRLPSVPCNAPLGLVIPAATRVDPTMSTFTPADFPRGAWTSRVEAWLDADLNIAFDAIARQLRIGGRSLRRYLEREGSSFRQLRDDARRRLTTRRLAQFPRSPAALASSSGFSDAPSLMRAVARWTRTAMPSALPRHGFGPNFPPARDGGGHYAAASFTSDIVAWG